MHYPRFRRRSSIGLIALISVLAFVIACGSASQPVTSPQQPSTASEAQPTAAMAQPAAPQTEATAAPPPTLLAPVGMGGRTPTPIPAGAAPTPTATPQPAPASHPAADNFGGNVPMATYSNPTKRSLYWGGSGLNGLGPAYSVLVEWNPEQPDSTVIRGDLATSWDIQDGGQTYVFYLNENATWHDGKPVTADDVVFSMDNMVCPDCFEVSKGRPSTSIVNIISDAYEENNARAIDEHTVEIKLRYPESDFLVMLTDNNAGMSPKHTVLDEGKLQEVYKDENLNGSGPFIRKSLTPDVGMVWEKYDDYWKEGYPRIDSMTHFVITDPGTLAAAYKTEQVLMQNFSTTPLNPLQARELDEEMADKLTVHWAGPSGLRGLYVMTRKAPFDDPLVRRAVSLVLHRQPIVDILSGGTFLIGTPLPPGRWYSYTLEEAEQMPGFRELDGEKHPDDIAAARELLQQGGYPDGLEVELSFRDCCGYPDAAALVADQLRNFLNWDVTLKNWETAAGSAAQDRGDFQFWFQGTSYALDTPSGALSRYASKGPAARRAVGGNASEGWVPDGLQDIINAVAEEQDPTKKQELALQAHDIMLNQDTNYIGVLWTARHWPVNNRIQNFHMHPNSYAQRKLEHIWCDPKC